ncbi:unnamed protein product [Periconia digitata]|uniref:Uncharacterized protein n=1 Tax=Periconia digitata TaxID=1303443 RepID=A0A9W4U970_9PLEO|nr:unnamed protein product [Periconia digitata]
MGIGETITVINKSGKVVSSSKHIVGVFKEAKSAYRERKAELKAERDAAAAEHKKLRDDMKSLQLDDDARSHASKHSRANTHRSSKSRRHHSRPPLERGYTDSFFANDPESPRSPRSRFEQDLASHANQAHAREMVRRNTEAYAVAAPQERTTRSRSESHIDMDLAYGDYIPPPLPVKRYEDGELREQASKLTRLLEEANCLQHSAVTTIENLQKNPDALAAVALTLAEISTMLGKMGPGVLLSFKSAFPAIVALLASPQFMIAAGVGVGVTVVALGGYRIIKKMQANKEEDRMLETPLQAAPPMSVEDSFHGLDELEPPELGRIELWRRGIADVQASSNGTSVDGEFITPAATRHLVAEGILDEDDIKSRRSTRSRHKSHRAPESVRSEKTSKTAKTAKTSKSTKTRKTTASTAASGTTSRSHTVREKREKEPSLVRQLFRSRTVAY